jgi:hypothetical protein
LSRALVYSHRLAIRRLTIAVRTFMLRGHYGSNAESSSNPMEKQWEYTVRCYAEKECSWLLKATA